MKSRISKVVFSDSTIKKAEQLKNIKQNLESCNGNALNTNFPEYKKEAKDFLNNITYQELEAVTAYLGEKYEK